MGKLQTVTVAFLDGPLKGQTRCVPAGTTKLMIPVLAEPVACKHHDDPTFKPDPNWTPRFGQVMYFVSGEKAVLDG